jgi:hypothetical protein
LFDDRHFARVYPTNGWSGALPGPPEPEEKAMYGHLKGFLGFLDLLAEGERRRAELIAGRHFEPALQPVSSAARAVKFPLSGHQKARWFPAGTRPKVSSEH